MILICGDDSYKPCLHIHHQHRRQDRVSESHKLNSCTLLSSTEVICSGWQYSLLLLSCTREGNFLYHSHSLTAGRSKMLLLKSFPVVLFSALLVSSTVGVSGIASNGLSSKPQSIAPSHHLAYHFAAWNGFFFLVKKWLFLRLSSIWARRTELLYDPTISRVHWTMNI